MLHPDESQNMLSKRRQTQNAIYCMNVFIWNVQIKWTHTDKKLISGYLGEGVWGRCQRVVNANGYRVSQKDNKNVPVLDSGDDLNNLGDTLKTLNWTF